MRAQAYIHNCPMKMLHDYNKSEILHHEGSIQYVQAANLKTFKNSMATASDLKQ